MVAAAISATSVVGRDGTETVTGVVDRITMNLATVLVERGGEVVDQRVIDLDRLPEDARHEGAVLALTLSDDEVESIEYDRIETIRRRYDLEDRFGGLSERLDDAEDRMDERFGDVADRIDDYDDPADLLGSEPELTPERRGPTPTELRSGDDRR